MGWKYVLAGVAAVGALGAVGKVGVGFYSDKKSEERAEKEAKENRLKAQATIAAEEFEKTWKPRFNSLLVIDSNIWMDHQYDELFKAFEWALQRFGAVIKMSVVQFDEITNLKNRPYSDPKSRRARLALARIENMMIAGALEVEHIGVGGSSGAYADPEIIEILKGSIPKFPVTGLVSDDRELRIRATQILKDNSAPDFKAVTGKTLEDELHVYYESTQLLAD
jgi:hypothetical protein